jgi:PAS domain S-box-containing protein/diguanylate cyclase (GGDEF)-like protein
MFHKMKYLVSAALIYAILSLAFLLAPDFLFIENAKSFILSPNEFLGLHAVVSGGFIGITVIVALVLLHRQGKSPAEAGARFDTALSELEEGVAIGDHNGVIAYANASFAGLFHLSAAGVVGSEFATLVRQQSIAPESGTLLPRQREATRKLLLRSDGPEPTQIAVRMVRTQTKGEGGWIITTRDVTMAESLLQSHALHLRAMDSSTEGIAIADASFADLPIIYVNRAFQEITGYTADELIGRNCRFLQAHDRKQPELDAIRAAIRNRKPVSVVLRNYTKAGALFWNDLRLAPVFDEAGNVTHFICVMRDVTQMRDITSTLEQMAHNDPVTGLLNRDGFRVALKKILSDEQRGQVAVIKLNIEEFHEINTTFGYKAGDALLAEIARRLTKIDGCVAARTYADNFVLAVPNGAEGDSDRIIERVQADLGAIFLVPGASLRVFFFCGYTAGSSAAGAGQLMREAAAALHEARSNRGRIAYKYNTKLDREISRRVRVTGDLQQAVANGDFILHYQPKVELRSGTVIGGEALIRWQHPTFGLQMPGRFIPAAEHTGLIVPIGEWALREAARFAVAVGQHGTANCRLAVNVSQMQFRQTDLPRLVESVLAETGVAPETITLELTESLFIDESPALLGALRRLREIGVGLSIDDFGTGFSSLRYLGSFPVTEIKIDRVFIKDMQTSRQKRAVVETVIRLGDEIGVNVVAEGIETEAERQMLIDLGCGYGQGYYFSIPLAADDFTWLLESGGALPLRRQLDHQLTGTP